MQMVFESFPGQQAQSQTQHNRSTARRTAGHDESYTATRDGQGPSNTIIMSDIIYELCVCFKGERKRKENENAEYQNNMPTCGLWFQITLFE